MQHPVRVYDPQGQLIHTHTTKELEKRADDILKMGYNRFTKKYSELVRFCKKCREKYKAPPTYKYCDNCRGANKYRKRSVPDTDCLIP